jgi:hypothetical protein
MFGLQELYVHQVVPRSSPNDMFFCNNFADVRWNPFFFVFLGGGCHDWHVFSLELNHCHDMILEAELLAMTRYSLCSVALEP